MKDTQIRKFFCTLMVIIRDFIKLMVAILVETILICVCIENGWIANYIEEVTPDEFWHVYRVLTTILIPLFMFYRGFTGKYRVDIKVFKEEDVSGYAKKDRNILSEEKSDIDTEIVNMEETSV